MTNFINTIDNLEVVGPTLIELWAYAQLDEICNYVASEWIADDGGLTAAASDVLALAQGAKGAITRGDSHWVRWDDMFDASTGTEQDILMVVWDYFNK